MADNLPLIPQKSTVCADVRAVLREVFRELDYLPPLPADKDAALQQALPDHAQWLNKYNLECEELWRREDELKQEHARRVAREPLPNIYHLSAAEGPPAPPWRVRSGLIARQDLVPTVDQNAGRDGSLWVQNILNRSSCDVSCMEVRSSRLHLPLTLLPADELTMQSLSMGELVVRRAPPPPPPASPPLPPERVLCVPPQLNFVNFTVGQLHMQSLRLVNVSKFEVRLSLRPPARRELVVQLQGARGLTVTSGAAAELRVRFTPRDVRPLRDELRVRVAGARTLLVPIYCYMQPPILDMLVPNVTWSSLSCTPGVAAVRGGGEVLELGARLLGDVHCARLLLHCGAEHASFFVLTEDAWLSYCLDTLSCEGTVSAGPFTLAPAWWRGGGAVRGAAWCAAPHAGLHAAALRVLASTAVVRPLHLLADALHFTPDHVTLEAQQKDYDICSADDPACEYYVHLGTAFPGRALDATVQLVNHSPMIYSYYWSVRPWGVCSCWEEERAQAQAGYARSDGSGDGSGDSERFCVGALRARDLARQDSTSEGVPPTGAAASVSVGGVGMGVGVGGVGVGVGGVGVVSPAGRTRVEPARGRVAPRSSCALHVCVPDVGTALGVQRAVLMLILKDIPKESFPLDYDPMVVKTEMMQVEPIPGLKPWSREVCEVVCCQLEVWWEVVPVRFVLDPPVLPLLHSRRVKKVDVVVRATQLYGCEGVAAAWRLPPRLPVPPPPHLAPVHSCSVTLTVPLPSLPNEYPTTDVFVLEAAGEEWASQSVAIRQCETRHPRLRPARAWLGVLPPGAHVTTQLELRNDTHQPICWWGDVWRWWRENPPGALCLGRQTCPHCHERACTCALLRPARGALARDHVADLVYDVNTPESDGCVATLIQVRRTLGDVALVPSYAGSEARASLVTYRVLAPRLLLRALPCHGDKVPGECEGCGLEPGPGGRGAAVLRPRAALWLGRCTCYRLRVTNLTPLPTTVTWEEPIEKEDAIRVTFIPNDFDVGSYGQLEIRMVIEARRVCGRRVFVYRASVARAYKPLYLLIDAAVAGLEVACEIPLGGSSPKPAALVMKTTQKEQFPWEVPRVTAPTVQEMFLEEDHKRAVRAENICQCRFKLVFVPEVKRPAPPRADDDPASIDIIWEPPPLTRVCACDTCSKPTLPAHEEPGCLQLRWLPLRTVQTRILVLQNQSVLTARWRAAVRYWPRRRNRTLTTDAWSVDIRDPGVALEVTPASGVLGPRARIEVTVSAYADCWGFYRDQIMIMIDKLEPLVVDVWIEAVGNPLTFSMQPRSDPGSNITLWMSSTDPHRNLRIKNTSRSELVLYSYMLLENAAPQDVLPFRLYLRFFDVLPRICPCVNAYDSSGDFAEEDSVQESLPEDMDTGVEVFLAADYGEQAVTHFTVEPEVTKIAAGAYGELQVSFTPPAHAELAPDAVLLIRNMPTQPAGPSWYRCEPEPQLVQLRQVQREGRLRVAVSRLRVRYCALGLPAGDVMRIRKTFRVLNVGNGHLHLRAATDGLWSIVQGGGHALTCGVGCGCVQRSGERAGNVALHLPPRSSMEMSVEVCIHTADAWPAVTAEPPSAPATPPAPPASPVLPSPPAPTASCKPFPACAPPAYSPRKKIVTPLLFYDEDNVLMTIPLILELEFPVLRIEPAGIDFGFVMDGDTRKAYFTVTHSSPTATLDLVVEWIGCSDFSLWPKSFFLPPGASERVYLQYTANWRGMPVEGCARVSQRGGDLGAGAGAAGPGRWCRAALPARARPARDRKCHAPHHDHTDDKHLLPPGLAL